MSLTIGQQAPDFKVLSDQQEEIQLSSFKGQKVILYFYPKDDTSGCTKQACGFKEHFPQFQDLNAVVLGVSKDSVASHQKFKAKYDLPFTLLSDEDLKICMAYGVWVDKSMYGKTYKGIERSTFLIDEDGKISHMWRKVKVESHIVEIMNKIKDS